MKKEGLSKRSINSIIIILIMHCTLVSGAFTVAQDAWIAVLLMGIFYVPLILIFIRIVKLFPGKGLFEIIDELFGKAGAFVLNLLMTLYLIGTVTLVLQNYTEFTVIVSLEKTPEIIIRLMLLLTAVYLAYQGLQVLGRWSLIVTVLIIIHLIITLLFSIKTIEPSNIMPVLDHSLAEIVQSSFVAGSMAMGEIVIILVLLKDVKTKGKPYKLFYPAIIIGVALYIIVLLRNLFVLGAELVQKAQFSTYMAVRIIEIGSFFERIESILSFIYILLGITKLAIYITAASIGTSHVLKSKGNKKFIMPAATIILAIASITFKNVLEMYEFIRVFSVLCIPFQVIIPIIIWLTAEFKKKKTAGIPSKVMGDGGESSSKESIMYGDNIHVTEND